jgi:hypothetical protein
LAGSIERVFIVMNVRLLLTVAVLVSAARAESPDLAALLAHPILDAGQALAEVEAYAEKSVPQMQQLVGADRLR